MFDWIEGIVSQLGYAGVAALTFLENLFPPIPSELVIPLAGFIAGRGELHIVPVIGVASVGSLAGATVWYALARRIGERRLREWVRRHGRWLTLSGTDLDRAQDWFDRHGPKAVLLGRLIPGVRTLVSVPAGFSGMALPGFLLYSTLGTVVWTAALACAGMILQANFTVVTDYMNAATNLVLAVAAVLVVRRYIRCWRAEARCSD